jgi:hypothetical protein
MPLGLAHTPCCQKVFSYSKVTTVDTSSHLHHRCCSRCICKPSIAVTSPLLQLRRHFSALESLHRRYLPARPMLPFAAFTAVACAAMNSSAAEAAEAGASPVALLARGAAPAAQIEDATQCATSHASSITHDSRSPAKQSMSYQLRPVLLPMLVVSVLLVRQMVDAPAHLTQADS